jgi:PadR family transcriptional regulator PadR
VETYRAASDGGPPRKYYRPSPEGRRALSEGVSEWRAARDALDGVLGVVRAAEAVA